MSKISLITTKMMKNLKYDGEINEEIKETNDLKINSKLYNWTFGIPNNEKIKLTEDQINELSMIESNENCIPLHIAKKHIILGLKFCEKVNLEAINSCLEIENQIIRIQATNEIPLYAVIRDIVLSSLSPSQLNVLFDEPRKKLIQYIMGNFLQGKNFTAFSTENYKVKKFYSSMFVFEPSDFDAAANHLVETFNDPNIPWKIGYIYVQESCTEKFHEKIVDKLKPFAKEILRDKSFVRDFKNIMEILIRLQAQQLGKTSSTEYFPIICHEFDRSYFDKTSTFSPVVVLKTVRTVEEAVKLAKHDGSNAASIWCMNHSLAYEIVNKLDYSMFWINCLGIIDSSLPIRISDLSKTDTDKFLKVFGKNGVYIKNSYHFEYFVCSQGSTKEFYKNIIFPIGTTFAN